MKIQDAKDAILAKIIEGRMISTMDFVPEDFKVLTEAYAILVNAETQALMTKHAIEGCEHGEFGDEVLN